MHSLLHRYAQLLTDEGCVQPGRVAVAALNDVVCAVGPADLRQLAERLLHDLKSAAVIVACPALPCAQLLLQRAPENLSALVPRDSESRSSLHDIPLIRGISPELRHQAILTALQRRKGCIADSIGMVAQGGLTVEQAYIAWSSLYHATTIKYLEDILLCGFRLPEEQAMLQHLAELPRPCREAVSLTSGPFNTPHEIITAMAAAGRATVQQGLVDSFFGNISYRSDDALYISQTAARLDELERQIDRIPDDDSSTAGITASSELPAHRAIAQATGCRAILHGHPRFPVALAFYATATQHDGIEEICGIPVVSGEGGMGGLAESVPNALLKTGQPAVIVKGHGVFSCAPDDFRHAFAQLVTVEERCRTAFFERVTAQQN